MRQGYNPPYIILLTIGIDESLLSAANPESMILDGFEAITIDEEDLTSFNNCVIFVIEEVL